MNPDWIAVDWGTTSLRAWAMTSSGIVLAAADSAEGMSGLSPQDFEPVLLRMIESWLPPEGKLPVVACGMVGAKQGWMEAPYAPVPWNPPPRFEDPAVSGSRFDLYICPGLKQQDPADVMRGEETQIAGVLATYPDFEGMICLPGTHSKWAMIEGERVQSFRTFLTGEMFQLLDGQSVLRHSTHEGSLEKEEFSAAVEIGFKDPAALASKLFSIRADSLLNGLTNSQARSRLSGYLIGFELGSARSFAAVSEISLVGRGDLVAQYRAALSVVGIKAKPLDGEEMTLAGLTASFARLER